jgi:hypothetical protein
VRQRERDRVIVEVCVCEFGCRHGYKRENECERASVCERICERVSLCVCMRVNGNVHKSV